MTNDVNVRFFFFFFFFFFSCPSPSPDIESTGWRELADIDPRKFVLQLALDEPQGGFAVFLDGELWNGNPPLEYALDHYAGALNLAGAVASLREGQRVDSAGWQVDSAEIALERCGEQITMVDKVYEFPLRVASWSAFRDAFERATRDLLIFLEGCRVIRDSSAKRGRYDGICDDDELESLRDLLSEFGRHS